MTTVARVQAAYARITTTGRPEVWITLRDEAQLLAEAAALDARVASGEDLPLAGSLVAVKDNIDVGGVPTSAACPSYAYVPDADAPAVDRLRTAGALVLGKTNMDQFATGLVGTRSPHGAVRDAARPELVSGGSSSGSAVAVALGIADLAIGTDTAGSGRVPAAFQGLVGVKPTFGLVPTRGSVPACRSLDCLTIFAADLELAQRAIWVMAGHDDRDPTSRKWPSDARLGAPARPRIAAPDPDELHALTPAARAAFAAFLDHLTQAGAELVGLNPAPLIAAGRLLYEGAFVAERYAAVGDFITQHPEDVDPTVGAIISASAHLGAVQLFQDQATLDQIRLELDGRWADIDAFVLPTTTRQPTIAEVQADPVATNAQLGTYTNFTNLLDLSAIALPAGRADETNFSVTLFGPAFHDLVLADIARRLLPGPSPADPTKTDPADGPQTSPADPTETGPADPPQTGSPTGLALLVVGAHRRGQPLNHELTERGGRFLAVVHTSADYRLLALDTQPPKPGLVRAQGADGTAIEGELWELAPARLADFLAHLPPPMTLGPVTLSDGRSVIGFCCEPGAAATGVDISRHGSWLSYLSAATAG